MDDSHEVPDWETPTVKPSLVDRVKNVFSKPSATTPPPISKESPTDSEKATAAPVAVAPDSPKPTPTRRMYFGRSRRTFFLALGAIIVLVVLAIGLGAGLGIKHSYVSFNITRLQASHANCSCLIFQISLNFPPPFASLTSFSCIMLTLPQKILQRPSPPF